MVVMGRGAATMAGAGVASKTVLITGVSKGLGRALALELGKRGHTVVGCARSEDKLASLLSDLSQSSSASSHLLLPVDVRSDSSVAELARRVIAAKGVPDIVVNNAGSINQNNKIWNVSAEEFDMVIDTNVKGVANVMRHFLPPMMARKQGVVVNLSSGWGRSVSAEVAPYCASKWAVEGLSRAAAKEVPAGMAIVALSPGVVNTEMLASCFGTSAALYESTDTWAPKAATMILNLSSEDNGASLSVS